MSSNCDKTLLMDYLYEEMDAARAQRFEQHLAGCEDCAQEAQSLKDARALLTVLPQQEVVEKLVFTAAPKRTLREWLRQASALLPRSAPVRLGFGFAGAFMALFVVGSLSNFQIDYNDAGFKISMSALPRTSVPLDEATKEAILTQLRTQQQVYVDQYLTSALQQQDQRLNSLFTSFDRRVNRRLKDNFETFRLDFGNMQLTSDARYDEQRKRYDNLISRVTFNPRN